MLKLTEVSSGYERLPVIREVSLEAGRGEILLVIGENGAGKSTLLRTIGGLIRPTGGSILLDGADISGREAEDIAGMGLRLVLDGHRVFPELSVWDNIRLGGVVMRDASVFQNAVDEVLSVFPILRERLKQPARDLSGGQQQMLALAQAFVAQPKVLLCDEPSLGLAQALLPPILAFLRRWAERGTAVVIVEQHIDIALGVADRVSVLDRGELKVTCSAKEYKEYWRGPLQNARSSQFPLASPAGDT